MKAYHEQGPKTSIDNNPIPSTRIPLIGIALSSEFWDNLFTLIHNKSADYESLDTHYRDKLAIYKKYPYY